MDEERIMILAKDILAYLEKMKVDLRQSVALALSRDPFELIRDYGELIFKYRSTMAIEAEKFSRGITMEISKQRCMKSANMIVAAYIQLRNELIRTRNRMLVALQKDIQALDDAKRVHRDADGMIAEFVEMGKNAKKEHLITRELNNFFRREKRYLGADDVKAKRLEGHVDEATGYIKSIITHLNNMIVLVSAGANHESENPSETHDGKSMATLDKLRQMEEVFITKMNAAQIDIRIRAKADFVNIYKIKMNNLAIRAYDLKERKNGYTKEGSEVEEAMLICNEKKKKLEKLLNNLFDDIDHLEREEMAGVKYAIPYLRKMLKKKVTFA